MNIRKSILNLALTLTIPCMAFAGFGDLMKRVLPAGGGEVNGQDILNKLNPGSILFYKAYAKYAEGLGLTEKAQEFSKMAASLEAGDKQDSNAAANNEAALNFIKENAQKAGNLSESASTTIKEGNKLYAEGIALLTAQTTVVTMAVKKAGGAAALIKNPELAAASAMCINGLADAAKFLDYMRQISGEKKEQEKSKDKPTN